MKKIYIEITNYCNLNCRFCKNTKRKKQNMTLENFHKIINQVKKYTKTICLHVKGEPLLYPNLKESLEIVNQNSLNINLTTNGLLLNRYKEIIAKSNCVRQINISLHSAMENENINIDEYFNNIFEAVSYLKDFNIIISYRLWNNEKMGEIDNNKALITYLEKQYKNNNLYENLKNNEWVELSKNIYINQDIKFLWPDKNSDVINESGRCLAIKDQIAILVNGDVVPCCIDSEGNIKLGNIYENDLDIILKSNRVVNICNNFQNNVITEDLCKRCGFLYRLKNKRKS